LNACPKIEYNLGMSDSMSPEPSAPPELPEASRGWLADFWDFLVHEKVWWMTPIIVVLVLMVGFIIFFEASPVLPFIYAM